MKLIGSAALIATVAIIGFATETALADDAGEFEYMSACAACHGTDGAGTGPMSEILTLVVPPLTKLASENGGVFPMAKVVSIIDGRSDVRAHGSGMPVWGAIFADPLASEVQGKSVDFITRGRILSLAYYLESIQE